MTTLRRPLMVRSCLALVVGLVLTSPNPSHAQPESGAPPAPPAPAAPPDGEAPTDGEAPPDGEAPTDGEAPPEPTVSPEVIAQNAEAAKLFDEGRTLMQEPDGLDRACETLGESYKLRQRGDVLLNLAECHRRQGKTATAWREFDEAMKHAEEVEFAEEIEAAKQLRGELAKTLSELVVEVSLDPAPPADLEIILDGKPLPSAQWRQPLYVDPGPHSATASAKGYEPFDQSVEVQSKGHHAVIKVDLKKIPEAPPPPPPAPEPEPAPPPTPPEAELPVWAFVVGGAGIIMLGVSVAFGIDTASVGGDLDDECGEDRLDCPPASTFGFESARDQELRSFGVFVGFGIGGLIATGVGAVGLGMALAGDEDKPAVALAPWAGPHGAGVSVTGTTW